EATHAAGRPTLLDPNQAAVHEELTALGVKQALAAPLVGPSGALGTLVVADRSGQVRDFSSADLHLFATLANHASVSLENNRLVDRLRDKAAALHVANRMVGLFEHPFLIREVSVDVGVSIGIAVAPAHGREPGTLVQRADVAMYTAKADQSGVEIYSPERDGYSAERLAL